MIGWKINDGIDRQEGRVARDTRWQRSCLIIPCRSLRHVIMSTSSKLFMCPRLRAPSGSGVTSPPLVSGGPTLTPQWHKCSPWTHDLIGETRTVGKRCWRGGRAQNERQPKGSRSQLHQKHQQRDIRDIRIKSSQSARQGDCLAPTSVLIA